MNTLFKGVDLSDFWEDSDYAREEYIDNPLTGGKVAAVEEQLGYKLPAAYVALSKSQNGGIPKRTNHRTPTPTSWSENHIAVSGIYSIGDSKPCSLLGSFGSKFWCEEWGYPPIGIYFADCPSAGHDMLCLDYRACGPSGEPSVVHVDQELDYRITPVAESFGAFIRGLEFDEALD
ncbi:MAG: SMI1/KNR4 family protein [Deltaproteobacteria bacterium]|nr:SMI1/KNR4 family protein [Deltaproteobacteria bacterium]